MMGTVLSAYGTPLMAVTLLKYLGQMLWSYDNDWLVVEYDI